jgi:hypothetical protein
MHIEATNFNMFTERKTTLFQNKFWNTPQQDDDTESWS